MKRGGDGVKKGSLDTNALLRLTLKDLPEQHEKVKKLVTQPKARFVVNDSAVIEYVFVLERYYELRREQIVEMVKALGNMDNLEVNHTLLNKALALYVVRPKLSFEDCYLAESAVVAQAVPLWTFDEKLARQSEHAELIR
jgi:predicted nucleic acid-binding protein